MEYSAFDGLVTFEVTGDNLRCMIVREGFERAVPEHKDFPPTGANDILFSNCHRFIGRTRSITFADGDLPESVQELRRWWELASRSTDYALIWREFGYFDIDVNNAWMEALTAYDAAQSRLLAPAEVQPGAESDEALEAAETTEKKSPDPAAKVPGRGRGARDGHRPQHEPAANAGDGAS